jgi:hypothetical protein
MNKLGMIVLKKVFCVDWNIVELNACTDLVIAPISDIEKAKLFGIPVDEKYEEKEKEGDNAADVDNIQSSYEDVDPELMQNVVDDVDDARDDELVNLYDKENHVIEVGRMFPSMDEFRMCFRTYSVRHEFETKTKWTDKKKFYAVCKGFDGGARPCKWFIYLLDANLTREQSG